MTLPLIARAMPGPRDVVQTWHDPQAVASGVFAHLNLPVGVWDRYHCVTPRPEPVCRCGRFHLAWEAQP